MLQSIGASTARSEHLRVPTHRRRFPVAVLAVGALAVDDVVDPTRTHLPLCPFHALTGWDCPLCGSLRSAYSLSHLQFAEAMRDNLLFVAALPVIIAVWLDCAARSRAGRPRRVSSKPTIALVVTLAIAFTALRNLPSVSGLRPS